MLSLSTRGKPRLAYGFWRYGEADVDTALRMLARVRESGIDHLDTADVYGGRAAFGGAERLMGELRTRAPELFTGAIVATKAGVEHGSPYNSSSLYLDRACEGSLRRLRMERVDLFYIHRPDLLAHPEDLAASLDRLLAAGKIGAIGVSNFTAAQVDALQRFLGAPIAVHQLEFSALATAPMFNGALDQAMGARIAAAAWSPLAGGRLLDGAAADDSPALHRIGNAIRGLAAEYGAPPEAVALAFVRAHPAAVTPILGTRTSERLEACLGCERIELSRSHWYQILEASLGVQMP
jgi:predicted oxidoreductase